MDQCSGPDLVNRQIFSQTKGISVASHQYTETLLRQQLQQLDKLLLRHAPNLTKFTTRRVCSCSLIKRAVGPTIGWQKLNEIQKSQKGGQLLVEKVHDNYKKKVVYETRLSH